MGVESMHVVGPLAEMEQRDDAVQCSNSKKAVVLVGETAEEEVVQCSRAHATVGPKAQLEDEAAQVETEKFDHDDLRESAPHKAATAPNLHTAKVTASRKFLQRWHTWHDPRAVSRGPDDNYSSGDSDGSGYA